jgi:hypothetical protein
MQDASVGVHLPATKVAQRYAVTPRTIDRWLDREALNFPKPLVVNNRRYWPLEVLLAWELAQAAGKTGATG